MSTEADTCRTLITPKIQAAGWESEPHFIKDVRRVLNAPRLPFVIGEMGQNGSKPAKGAMLTIQQAQLATKDVPECEDNVKAIRTDGQADHAVEERSQC